MNFQLYNNSLEDWSLGKQLILFHKNLNVLLGRQNLKLFPSGSVSVYDYVKMIYMKLLNLIQCSVTDVCCYICVDNSTWCNFMLHVCWIFCA